MNRVIPIRASSFGNLFSCAHRWEAEHILGMRRPSSLRAHLGTSIHAGTAAFDQATIDGSPLSVTDAVDATMEVFDKPRQETDMRDERLPVKEAARIAVQLTMKYCREIAPTMEYVAVEMALDPLEIETHGVVIRLTGNMDRARVSKTEYGHVIPDLKSGSRLIRDGQVIIHGRAPQVGTYELLYTHTTCEPTAGGQIIALQTTSKCETGVSKVFDAKSILVGDDENPGLIEVAGLMLSTGSFPPNTASPLCSERYCVRYKTCRFVER
jgi:hypothetical protein